MSRSDASLNSSELFEATLVTEEEAAAQASQNACGSRRLRPAWPLTPSLNVYAHRHTFKCIYAAWCAMPLAVCYDSQEHGKAGCEELCSGSGPA